MSLNEKLSKLIKYFSKFFSGFESSTSQCGWLIESLTTQRLYRQALLVISRLLELGRAENLDRNENFLSALTQIIHADDTYYNYAKSFVSSEFPGSTLKMVAKWMEFSVVDHSRRLIEGNVRFWMRSLLNCGIKQPWFTDRMVLYLVDYLGRVVFLLDPGLVTVVECLQKYFHVSSGVNQ